MATIMCVTMVIKYTHIHRYTFAHMALGMFLMDQYDPYILMDIDMSGIDRQLYVMYVLKGSIAHITGVDVSGVV